MQRLRQYGMALGAVGVLVIALCGLIVGAKAVGAGQTHDLLAYSLTNRMLPDAEYVGLYVYDPHRHVSMRLTEEGSWNGFSFSSSGQLAYEADVGGQRELYVLDIFGGGEPMLVSAEVTGNEPLRWSDDGRYLAFTRYADNGDGDPAQFRQYVWDGDRTIDVTPNHDESRYRSYISSWSPDGRLAFTINKLVGPDRGEIYLWDGQITVNLSQSSNTNDRSFGWNRRSELAFLSTNQGDRSAVWVWDGVSYRDGVPDRDTFTVVAQNLVGGVNAAWAPDDTLIISIRDNDTRNTHLYRWDRHTLHLIDDLPFASAYAYAYATGWHEDGRRAVRVDTNIIVSDPQNVALATLDTGRRYMNDGISLGWSEDGQLAFCAQGRSQFPWTLSVWDGQRRVDVAHGPTIFAQWQGGERVVCYFAG